MKKRKLLPLAALVLILAIAAWLLFAPQVCIAPIEQRADGQWSLLHVYMSGEYTYDLPSVTDKPFCDFTWVSGRGSFQAEITNAAGEVLCSTDGGKDGTIEIPVASDLTLHLKTRGHGGMFSLTLKEQSASYYTAGILRSDVITMLWEAAGAPVTQNTVNPFTDVSEDDYFYNAVLWAVEAGITTGTSATEFSPDRATNRAQAVTFLWRYLDKPEHSGNNVFPDVEEEQFYTDAVLWAYDKGVTLGLEDGTFGIKNRCTRAHMDAFLERAMAD